MLMQQDYRDIAIAIFKNDWDERAQITSGKFSIAQFQGTAFDSEYACYKVSWEEKRMGSIPVTRKVVAKITGENELNALSLVKGKRLLVPQIDAHVRLKDGRILIFEQFLEGSELYSSTDVDAWVRTASKLAELHLAFWKIDEHYPGIASSLQVSKCIMRRIQDAVNHTSRRSVWRSFAAKACARIEEMPKTLIHGIPVPDYIEENVSTKVVKIIQSYTGVVNKMVWRKF